MKIKLIAAVVVTFFVSDALTVYRTNRYNQKRFDLLAETIDLFGSTLIDIAESPEDAEKILKENEAAGLDLTERLNAFVN